MMDAHHNLADAWIRFHQFPKESSGRDELEWAWEQLDDLCRTEPDAAWQIIQEIIARDKSDRTGRPKMCARIPLHSLKSMRSNSRCRGS
jgi:hypothetical protein